jgi:hypothetical protein
LTWQIQSIALSLIIEINVSFMQARADLFQNKLAPSVAIYKAIGEEIVEGRCEYDHFYWLFRHFLMKNVKVSLKKPFRGLKEDYYNIP